MKINFNWRMNILECFKNRLQIDRRNEKNYRRNYYMKNCGIKEINCRKLKILRIY